MTKDIIFSIDNTVLNITQPNGAFVEDQMHYTDIEDATEISTRAFNKMTTSIPTPFARVFLYEGAFKTLIDRENKDEGGTNPYKGKAFYGKTINHYVVADALDMLEFLFEYGDDPCLKVEKWTIEDLHLLKAEDGVIPETREVTIEEKHNLLYESLKSNTTEGILGGNFYIFKWCYYKDGMSLEEIIGATSPLTLLYSAPNWRINKPNKFYGGNGNELFIKDLTTNIEPCPLIRRSKLFRGYVYALNENFGTNSPFFQYIRLTRTNYENNVALQNATFDSFSDDLHYLDIKDSFGNSIKVKGLPLKCHDKSLLDEDCEFVIQPTVNSVLDEYNTDGVRCEISKKLPLVLSTKGIEGVEKPHYWYESDYRKNSEELIIPSNDLYYERTLPNVPGKVKYPNLRVEDFFEDKIVKVSYNLDSAHFITGRAGNCQYLLPLKPIYFKFFKPEDLKLNFSLVIQDDGIIKATLSIPVRGKKRGDSFVGGIVKLEKTYVNNTQSQVKQIMHVNQFNLALFPFYRLEGDDSRYNCYEVMLGHDGKTQLKFYDKDVNDFTPEELINRGRSSVMVKSKTDRTKDNDSTFGITTTYYRLGGSQVKSTLEKEHRNPGSTVLEGGSQSVEDSGSFLFMKALFGNGICALIVPDWGACKSNLSTNEYVVSVDFGTTNTHVSYALIDKDLGVVDPTSINDLKYGYGAQVVALNEYGSKGIFPQFDLYMQREFVPMKIGNDADVLYPIRTLIYEKSEAKTLQELFGDMNIAFALNEDESRGLNNGQLKSNIKWDNDPNSRNRIGAFFTETMWIVKNKMVELGGNMNFKFIFTFPQSMGDNQQKIIIDEWKKARNNVRAGDPGLYNWNKEIKSISGKRLIPYEGTAPWYRSIADFGTTKSFLNIDIGGGTFDVIAVQPTPLQVCQGKSFSARFAANELWGEGQQKTAILKNGFYEYYKTTEYCSIFMENDKGFSNYYNPPQDNGNKAPLPSEIIPYLFKHDDCESEFSTTILNNNKLRSLIVLHFCSIIYYVGRVLMLAEINCPSRMQFTGMGSLYIKLISDNEDILTSMVKAVLRYASSGSVNIPDDFHVKFNLEKQHPKKITAEGALMMWNTTLPSAKTPIVDSSEVMIYGFEGDEDELVSLKENQIAGQKDAVMTRIEDFLGIFGNEDDLSDIKNEEKNNVLRILNSIGISDVSHLKYNLIKACLSDSFDLMNQEYNATANSNVTSKEAVFFWPLKNGIHKLALEYANCNN